MKTVTIVAKGPTAVNANDWCKPGRTSMVSINDSYKLFDRKPNYSFISDMGALDSKMGPERISRLFHPAFSSDVSITEGRQPPLWYTELLNNGKVVTYPDRYCPGGCEDFDKRIAEGGICHHSTVAGAMHYVVKVLKYEKVRLIGVDGGTEFAPGVGPITEVTARILARHNGKRDYMTLWKKVFKNLAIVLHNHYGTVFEWYGE